jgi:pimeloyl-ACP methyl ester carboxylesterase
MSGGESLLLRRRLSREFGMDVHPFRYAAAASTMTEITSRLQRFVRDLKASRLHFVGHSLGGLVIYRFLERYPQQPPGRVVFLGTPSVASRAAVQAGHIRLVASLMGRPVADELLQRTGTWESLRVRSRSGLGRFSRSSTRTVMGRSASARRSFPGLRITLRCQ